jgi:hypothetical protein
VGEDDLDQTISKLSSMHSEKLAIKLAIIDVPKGPESSLAVSTPLDDETKKPKESLGFVSICRLLADAGFSLRIGEEGRESLRLSQGIQGVDPQLAIKLAKIDVSSLWKTLEDEDKISTLLFLEQLQRVRGS